MKNWMWLGVVFFSVALEGVAPAPAPLPWQRQRAVLNCFYEEACRPAYHVRDDLCGLLKAPSHDVISSLALIFEKILADSFIKSKKDLCVELECFVLSLRLADIDQALDQVREVFEQWKEEILRSTDDSSIFTLKSYLKGLHQDLKKVARGQKEVCAYDWKNLDEHCFCTKRKLVNGQKSIIIECESILDQGVILDRLAWLMKHVLESNQCGVVRYAESAQILDLQEWAKLWIYPRIKPRNLECAKNITKFFECLTLFLERKKKAYIAFSQDLFAQAMGCLSFDDQTCCLAYFQQVLFSKDELVREGVLPAGALFLQDARFKYFVKLGLSTTADSSPSMVTEIDVVVEPLALEPAAFEQARRLLRPVDLIDVSGAMCSEQQASAWRFLKRLLVVSAGARRDDDQREYALRAFSLEKTNYLHELDEDFAIAIEGFKDRSVACFTDEMFDVFDADVRTPVLNQALDWLRFLHAGYTEWEKRKVAKKLFYAALAKLFERLSPFEWNSLLGNSLKNGVVDKNLCVCVLLSGASNVTCDEDGFWIEAQR